MKAKKNFRASRGMIGAMRLYFVAFGSVTALIYQLPHPWGASDGPVLPAVKAEREEVHLWPELSNLEVIMKKLI